ncbi:MAG: hypothetical protein ABSC06_10600 [Rhodopila sp.]|jgi:hypothetical protein
MNDSSDKTVAAAKKVADKLDQRGHKRHAGALRAVLAEIHPRSMFLRALRETCQTVLTAIEAVDPVCATLVEELRLEVDKRVREEHSS